MKLIMLIILTAILAGNEVYASSETITLPYPVEDKHENDVNTPWGKAHAVDYSTTDPDKNIFYSFTVNNFAKKQKYHTDLLNKTPDYFLLHKKCVAEIAQQTALEDSDGKIWPQITFKGRCASYYSEYIVLVLIADNHVYQFHVGYLQYPKNPELMKKDDLDSALKELLSRFSILKTPDI